MEFLFIFPFSFPKIASRLLVNKCMDQLKVGSLNFILYVKFSPKICNFLFVSKIYLLRGSTPSYILHTRAFGTYLLGGLFTLHKILQGDGILHVNMFHYFKIPYFTCTFFTKFIYNEYIGPYILSHFVSKCFASEPPQFICCSTTHQAWLFNFKKI